MTWNPDPIEVVTFDSFSTLADVDSTAEAIAEYVEDPITDARRWHSLAAKYGMVCNHIDEYDTYYELHIHTLDEILRANGVRLTWEELDDITAIYHNMDVFDDVRPGMLDVTEKGYSVGIISNGDPPMLDSLVQSADIGHILSDVISADEIERFKPDVELYRHAAKRFDVDPSAIAHVANGQTDVQGAMNAGLSGVWLDRQDRPPRSFGPDPDLSISTIHELVDRL